MTQRLYARVFEEDWYRPAGQGYVIYTPKVAGHASIIVSRHGPHDWYIANYDGRDERVIKSGFPAKEAAMRAVQGMFPVKRSGRS